MNLGERLKKLRELRKLTLEEVGNHIGVNKATVQRYESGNIDIKRNVAINLAELFKVSPSYIMGWTNNISVYGDVCFSKNLKQARLRNYLTTMQLVKQLGVAETTYAGYEEGWLEPDIEVIRALTKLLGISSDELLGVNCDSANENLSPCDFEEIQLLESFRLLNKEGQEKIAGYIDDLVVSGKYIKNCTNGVARKAKEA